MGCVHAKLSPWGHAAETSVPHQNGFVPRPEDSSDPGQRSKASHEDAYPLSVKLHGLAVAGDGAASALLCSRLVVARGHILAAVFEGHVSTAAAEYCRNHCWEAFLQALANPHHVPAAATLRLLDRGFLTSSQQSLEARLSSGCSATLLHVDLIARTATVATVGAHGSVGVGCVAPRPSSTAGAQGQQWRRWLRCLRRGGGGAKREAEEGGERDEGGCRQARVSRVVTLEAPNGESRRGLSGLVDLVQAALDPAGPSAAALEPPPSLGSPATATATSAAHGGGAGAGGGVAGSGSGNGSVHGGAARTRRGGSLTAGAGSTVPQALGFGCAKDGVSATPLDGSAAAASASASASAGYTAPAPSAATSPSVHGLQAPFGGRFAALSRIHCACEVRVTSRQLDAGDECFVLLAGSGAVSASARGAARGGGGGGSGEGAVNGGPRTFIGSAGACGGGGSSNSQVHSSMLLVHGPSCPATALSPADAVTLAYELAAGGWRGLEAGAPQCLPSGRRLELLYDSLEAEQSSSRPPVAAPAGGSAVVGDKSALAVASYALAAAALRKRSSDAGRRSSGGVQSPSAACIVVWLDWQPAAPAAATAGSTGATVAALPVPVPQSPASSRWDLLRAYCRFRMARRRRIIGCWRALVAQCRAGTPLLLSLPLAPPVLLPSQPQQPPQQPSSSPPWLLARLSGVLALGNASTVAAGLNSVDSCLASSAAAVTAAAASRTASFTSRAPVMMEFVEELPPGVTSTDAAAAAAVAAAASASVTAPASATAAGATLDESHSASATAPYGISGLVVAPMGSTEDVDEDVGQEESGLGVGHQSQLGAAAAAQRSFVLHGGGAAGSRHNTGPRIGGGFQAMLRASHSSPDLNALEARAQALQQQHHQQHQQVQTKAALTLAQRTVSGVDSGGGGGGSTTATSRSGSAATSASAAAAAAAAAQAEALAFACGSGAGYSATHRTAGGASAAGASGCAIDWSLVMTSVTNTSGPRTSHSAGHTPIPSSAGSRVSPQVLYRDGGSSQLSGLRPSVTDAAAAQQGRAAGISGDLPAAGGYLHITGGQGFFQRKPAHQLATSPVAGGIYFPRPTLGRGVAAAAALGARRPEGNARDGVVLTTDPVPPGVLVGRRSISDDPDGEGGADGDSADPSPTQAEREAAGNDATETDAELVSEDLPQLRIESTAELAALMAEIIITEDGEVVRTGGSGGLGVGPGGCAPPPYVSRTHHHHQHLGLGGGHKSGRVVSRQGGRGWQPRLAIVREDARETNPSTSCSQVLLGDGLRFTAISEERSQSSSSSATEHLQGSGSERGSVSHSRTSSSSPNGSVEEAVAAFGSIVTATANVNVNVGAGAVGAAAGIGPLPAPTVHSAVPVAHSPFTTAGAGGAAGSSSSQPRAAGLKPPAFVASAAPVVPGAVRVAARPGHPPLQLNSRLPPPWSASAFMGTVPEDDVMALPGSPISPGRSPFLPPSAAAQVPPTMGRQAEGPSPDALAAAVAGRQPACAAMLTVSAMPGGSSVAVAAVGSSGAGPQSEPLPPPLEPAADVASALPSGCVSLPPPPPQVPLPSLDARVLGPFPVRSPPLPLDFERDAGSNDGTVAQPLAGAAAALEDVLNDLNPSLDRERIQVEAGAGCLASGAGSQPDVRGSGSGVIVVSAAASPSPPRHGPALLAAAGGVEGEEGLRPLPPPPQTQTAAAAAVAVTNSSSSSGVGSGSGSLSSGGGFTPQSAALGPVAEGYMESKRLGRSRSRSSTQLRSLAPDTVAAVAAAGHSGLIVCGGNGDVSLAAGDGSDAGGGGERPALGLVGRSHSMLVSRPRHNPLHPHPQLGLSLGQGRGSSAAANPLGAQRHSHHHGHHPAAHTSRNTRHLYGLTEPQHEPSAAARSSSSAAATSVAAVQPHAGEVGTATIDRSWSVGSASGPLYSLLHSTLSKSSMTGIMSTAVPTPGCTSAQGSNSRLPTLPASSPFSPGAQQTPPPPPVVATVVSTFVPTATAALAPYGGGGAGAGGATGSSSPATGSGFARALPRSLSASRHEPSGLGTPTRYVSAGAPTAVAPPPPMPPPMVLVAPSAPSEYDTALSLADSPALAATPRPSPLAPWLTRPAPPHGGNPAAALPQPPSDARFQAPHAKESAALGAAAAEGTLGRHQEDMISPPQHSAPTGVVPWPPLTAAAPPRRSSIADGNPGGGGGATAAMGDGAGAYDDGAATNRSSYISRSDASVWNSTSVWTNSTGRTTDILVGGSSRRVGTGTLGGAMTCGIGTGGDTSGLIAYNAAYSSVSGLLMTADAGAPGSNTQLLMQMGGGGAGGQSNSNAQHSTQLLCSPQQAMGVFAGGGGDVGATPSEAAAAAANIASVVAASQQQGPPRSQTARNTQLPGPFGVHPQLQEQAQAFLDPGAPQSQPRPLAPSQPHASGDMQPQQQPQQQRQQQAQRQNAADAAAIIGAVDTQRQHHHHHHQNNLSQDHPPQHHHHQNPALQEQDRQQADMYRTAASVYDSGAEGSFMVSPGGAAAGASDTVSINLNGLIFAGNSTYNNAAHLSPLMVSNASRTAASGNAPRATRGLGSEHHGLLGMGLDTLVTDDALLEG